MSIVSEDQSMVNPDNYLVLLYQSSFRQNIQKSDFSVVTKVEDYTVSDLTNLILKSWDSDAIGIEKPKSSSQLRLIYLGRQLDDPKAKLSEFLKLDISDIVHVNVRPPESGISLSKRASSEGSKCCIIV